MSSEASRLPTNPRIAPTSLDTVSAALFPGSAARWAPASGRRPRHYLDGSVRRGSVFESGGALLLDR